MVSKNTREKDENTRKTKRNKNMKERGITLIALVVTIIVLLILAGISIQMLVGDNGILKKVAEAASKTDIADYKEELDLLGVDLLIDETVGGKSSTFLEKYKAKIQEKFPDATVTDGEDESLIVETKEGHVFKVTEDGAEYLGEKGDEGLQDSLDKIDADIKIKYSPTNWTKDPVTVTIEKGKDVPEGYTIEHFEGTNEPQEEEWTEYTGEIKVNNNTKIYARLLEGEEVKATATEEVTKIDMQVPTSVTLTAETINKTTVEVTATAQDGLSGSGSGVSGIAKFVYSYTETGKNSYSTPEEVTIDAVDESTKEVQQSYQYTKLKVGTKYTLKVEAYDQANNKQEYTVNVTTKASQPSVVPQLGKGDVKYADIDGDDTPDAVIYADLSAGGSGIWNPSGTQSYDEYGTYTITQQTGPFKEYTVVNENYDGAFGSGQVLAYANESAGEGRFYVMALEDEDNGEFHCWFADAYEGINDYNTKTLNDFKAGLENTNNMLEAWNGGTYGGKDKGSYTDVWGLVESKRKKDGKDWFVPSRGEWAAFADKFDIDSSTYSSFKLNGSYWSSSLRSVHAAWGPGFNLDAMGLESINDNDYVRLSLIF